MDVLPELSNNNVCQQMTKTGRQAVQEEVSKVVKKIAVPMLTLRLLKVCLAVEVPCY
jgi:hypothetical protein